MAKYTPKTKDELKRLVQDESIYLGDIDTSNITDMDSLFSMSERRDYDDIEKWDTSNVANMSCMFFANEQFNHDINSWDTSKVVDMTAMFMASIFNQPLNKWNTSNVISMYRMFYEADFNHPLDSWDTSSVEFMTQMFHKDFNFNQNLDSWDVSSLCDNQQMFWDSGMDKVPKWHKKKICVAELKGSGLRAEGLSEIYDEIGKRVKEVLANPQAKAKAKAMPEHSKVQSGDFDFWQGKNTIIIVIVALLIGVSAGFIKNKFKESNKAKLPPTQTTQPAKQTQPTQMPRCDDSALLNHLVKTHKEQEIARLKQKPDFQNYNAEDFIINQYKFNIVNVKSLSNANKEIVCEAELEAISPNPQDEPFYEFIAYRAQLNDDNSIGFEILEVKYANP
ncbi:BspA family leucine-rich repeat surface protein [Helicobacter sp. 23-1044]